MYSTHINSTRNRTMNNDYRFFHVGILSGDKVVQELPNVMARNRQEATMQRPTSRIRGWRVVRAIALPASWNIAHSVITL